MIIVPDSFWAAMLDAFDQERPAVEQVCYFDGPISPNGDSVVSTLTLPNAQLMSGQFSVSADAMRVDRAPTTKVATIRIPENLQALGDGRISACLDALVAARAEWEAKGYAIRYRPDDDADGDR